ncbi:YceI family protein [Flavobacterium paronense]|uniref:YceI family protein n=1 Tax=Flavobacterium paronense TaxID=1392775 RepID=A0ABV5GCA6_9FLAO|nr:YceI family protein [Flavobacterium paronense]MDN3677866.1 YceI family protein [Flavobacterium paronense]
MKKIAIVVVALLIGSATFSQKMITRSGEIKFDATVPGAMDEVIGTNKTVSSIFDKATGEVVVQAMVKSFKFKSPLMEEHFNENYMESDKLPKASFKGKVINYDAKSGNYEVEGDLTMHGVTNKVKSKMAVNTEGDKVSISGSFSVKLSDYKIDVPALAKKTLAETSKISIKLTLENK